MTEAKQLNKKISRRDAIKLLGAVTCATVLANLPSKWSTPEIAKGVLPAHAQTSDCWAVIFEVTVNLLDTIDPFPSPDQINMTTPVTGFQALWACQTGCLFVGLNNVAEGSAATVQFTTSQGTQMFIVPAGEYHSALINMSTGEIGFDGVPVAGCTWPG